MNLYQIISICDITQKSPSSYLKGFFIIWLKYGRVMYAEHI